MAQMFPPAIIDHIRTNPGAPISFVLPLSTVVDPLTEEKYIVSRNQKTRCEELAPFSNKEEDPNMPMEERRSKYLSVNQAIADYLVSQ